MGVLKNLQNLSDLEFYKCAEKLQDDITDFCLRNFGLKKSPRNVNQIIKDISEEDQSEINKKFEKYGKTSNQQYASEYPEWFIDNRKRRLLSYTDDLIDFIIFQLTQKRPKNDYKTKGQKRHEYLHSH